MPARKKPAAPRAARMTTRDYGFEGAKAPPGKRYPWSKIERQMKTARNYWIGTTRADGRPHSAPVWGVWQDGVFYFSTGDTSVKGRNIARDPRITVHPELIDDAIILEGTVDKITSPKKLTLVWKSYKAKYKWDVAGTDFYALRPDVVFSYSEPDFIESATKWTFPKRRSRG